MKKFIAIILVLITITSSTFAYQANDSDTKFLNTFYKKVDNIGVKSPAKIKTFGTQVDILKEKHKNNDRVYFLLSQIVNYINNKYNVNKVVKVIDGDTVQINYNGKESSFRLIGLDSPESYATRFGYKECFGDDASKYLKGLLNGKSVRIEFDETQGQTDKYGRYLAYIFLDGVNINNDMIQKGYAWEYTYNKAYKYQDIFKTSQKYASDLKVGLWATGACNGERKKIETTNIGTTINTGSLNILNGTGSIINIGNFTCSVKKTYCSEMNTCEEAKFYLNSCGLSRLDADKDGIPCESLCN